MVAIHPEAALTWGSPPPALGVFLGSGAPPARRGAGGGAGGRGNAGGTGGGADTGPCPMETQSGRHLPSLIWAKFQKRKQEEWV